ncbi:MAG: alginate lyase family protein [Ignavibacteriales bacterium]|nr:alginate lyase family protein [Ignavibacteriales bacterium]
MNQSLKISIAIFVIFLIVLKNDLVAQQSNAFILDLNLLSKVRESIQANKKEYKEPYKKLLRDADKILEEGPWSITEKEQTPPSGDKHDYMSLGKYWWPDPSKPDGLPYIRKDGETNPETETISDSKYFDKVGKNVQIFGLAYFFSGDEKYAEKAVSLIKTWFIDPKTKMNPNFNFGQMIKGKKSEGMPSGLIESRPFHQVIEGVGFMEGSKSWTEADQKSLVEWFGKYYQWLNESDIALKESASTNNHGIWFDVQKVSIALFIGKRDDATAIVNEAKAKRIAAQIDTEGKQARELARTRSLHYTYFNIDAMFKLASLAEKVGVDLWSYKTEDDRSIKKALDWVMPYVLREKKWENEQIDEFKMERFYPIFLQAAYQYKDEKYLKAADEVSVENTFKDKINLCYPRK